MRQLAGSTLIAALVGLLTGCGSARLPIVSYVEPCTPTPTNNCRLEKEQLFYALPRAVVTSTVDVRKIMTKPGKCATSTKLFEALGVATNEVVRETRQSFVIPSYALDTQTEPDPTMVFAVELGSKRFQTDSQTLDLSESGTIRGAKATARSTVTDFAIKTVATAAQLAGKLLSPSPISEGFDAQFSGLAADPKACKENEFCCRVHDQIVTARSGKLTLLASPFALGENKESVAFRVEKLDQLEKSLLANFKGVSSIKTGKIRCTFTPGATYNLDRSGATVKNSAFVPQPSGPLFAFSSQVGIRPATSTSVTCVIPSAFESSTSVGYLKVRIHQRLSDNTRDELVQKNIQINGSTIAKEQAQKVARAFVASLEKSTTTSIPARGFSAAAAAAAIAGLPAAICPLDVTNTRQAAIDALAQNECDATCASGILGVGANQWNPTEIVGGVIGLCAEIGKAIPTITFKHVELLISPVNNGLADIVAVRQTELTGDRGYFYRVPASGLLSLALDGEVKLSAEEPIPQFGVVSALPSADAFKSKRASYVATFFDDLGALKKLETASSGDEGSTIAAFGEAVTPLVEAELARRAADNVDVDELADLQRQQAILEALLSIRSLEDQLGVTEDDPEEP